MKKILVLMLTAGLLAVTNMAMANNDAKVTFKNDTGHLLFVMAAHIVDNTPVVGFKDIKKGESYTIPFRFDDNGYVKGIYLDAGYSNGRYKSFSCGDHKTTSKTEVNVQDVMVDVTLKNEAYGMTINGKLIGPNNLTCGLPKK